MLPLFFRCSARGLVLPCVTRGAGRRPGLFFFRISARQLAAILSGRHCLSVGSLSVSGCRSRPVSVCRTPPVSVCRCRSVFVCRSLSAPVSQSLSVSVCRSLSVSVCRSLSASVSRTPPVSVCRCRSVSICRSLSVSVCRSLSASVCRSLSVSVSRSLSASDCLAVWLCVLLVACRLPRQQGLLFFQLSRVAFQCETALFLLKCVTRCTVQRLRHCLLASLRPRLLMSPARRLRHRAIEYEFRSEMSFVLRADRGLIGGIARRSTSCSFSPVCGHHAAPLL